MNKDCLTDATTEPFVPDAPVEDETNALVKQAQAGDEAAFAVLVETYEKFVYHTALRVLRMYGGSAEDGEDVAQNAFLKAWRSLPSFRGDCAFSTWLYRIAVNCARDHCRTEARRQTVPLTHMDSDTEEEVTIDVPVLEGDTVPESALDRQETIRMVREAIEELPPDMRAVILLRDLQDMPYASIAELLHLEIGTVKSRLNRARHALKARLEGIGFH